MKNVRLLIIFAISVFIIAMAAILTQDINAQDGEDSSDRGTIIDDRQEARELRQETALDTIRERLKLRGTNVLSRATLRSNRLTEIMQALQSAVEKAKANVKDVAKAETALVNAQTALNEASNLTTEAESIISQFADTTDLKTTVDQFKGTVKSIYENLHEARTNLREAIQVLRTNR